MLKSSVIGFSLAILFLATFPGHFRGDDSKTDEKVMEVVNQFLKAIKDKDVDRLVKLADVPWLAEEERIIKDDVELKKLWKQKLVNPENIILEILDILPYSKPEEIFKDKKTRKLLEQILGKKDGIVIVGNKKSLTLRYILVRTGEGIPKIVGGPYKFTYLLKPNQIPDRAKEFLEKADQCELFSLDPNRQKEKAKDHFHNWKVLGKTEIKMAETRKKLLSALKQGFSENEGLSAACFNPRHGIRLVHKGKKVDFVICFECFQVEVFNDDKRDQGFLISDSPQPVFDKVLVEAKVPLPKKADN